MLKIEDSVDLKELEKFGFKKEKNLYRKNILKLHDDIYYYEIPKITLEVISNPESDYYRCLFFSCGGIKREMSEMGYDTFDDELDTLYDLFENNLIRKV